MQATLDQLTQQYRRFKRLVFGIILILVIALVCIFINRNITFILLAFAVLFHLFYVRRQQKAYQEGFVEANMKVTLAQDIGAKKVSAMSGGKITEEVVRDAQMAPVDKGKGSCLLREGVSGEHEGLKVALCDAVMAESWQLVKNGKNRVHYLMGVWTSYTLSHDTGADWRLLDKDVLAVPIRQKFYKSISALERIHYDDEELEERFILYSKHGSVPDQKVMREIIALADYTPGKIAVSLKGDKLNIFIRDRILARAVSVKNPPTAEALKFHPFPEIRYTTQCAKRCDRIFPKDQITENNG